MKHINYSNGFYIELSSPNKEKEMILRLYTPDDIYITSVSIKDAATAESIGTALMQGFFDGFRFCKHKLRKELTSVFVNTGIVDVQK